MTMDGIQGNRAVGANYSTPQIQQGVQSNGSQKASIFSGNKVKQLTREVNGVKQTIYVGKDHNGNKIRTDANGNILITISKFGKNTYITADKLQPQVIVMPPQPQPVQENITEPAKPGEHLPQGANDEVEIKEEPAPKPDDSEDVKPKTPFMPKRPVPGDGQLPNPPHGRGLDPGRDHNIKPPIRQNPVYPGYIIDDPKPAPSPKPPVKNQPKPTTPKPLTPQERNTARHYGDNVSDYLVGYTDDSEKGLTKEVITKHVNNRNVMDFLAGYERNKGLGDHFFTQLGTEYAFEEKQNLMKNVAIKLSQYLKANGQPHLAREVDVALKDNGFSRQEMTRMDQIVQTMLTTIPGLKI